MTKRFYTPTLTNTIGYYIISPQGYRQELDVSEGRVFDGWKSYTVGKDAFDTIEDVQKKAEEMRKKKIASLEKQVKKLKAISFV